eukprot:CAMPEP_0168339990 /NCGR_PEP_ID=MMETSP0213-20121227/13798_1 /TAXON_ID=151035 /ORGANISM="Euplotes harpa, Strain FSP1.4" /LENGTH=40 /DNA_ID= /DNA_START= /DNA_END= /DNA_ORIENTATION=
MKDGSSKSAGTTYYNSIIGINRRESMNEAPAIMNQLYDLP